MADTPNQITVTAKLSEPVLAPIAKQLCEDFAEWLDEQGFHISPAAEYRRTDERSYAELARDFVKTRLGEE